MSTAVTASVWGQGLAAIKLSAQVATGGMKEGDEECHICRDDIPATIAFVPCKHKVCFTCMESMRAKNIFKVCVWVAGVSGVALNSSQTWNAIALQPLSCRSCKTSKGIAAAIQPSSHKQQLWIYPQPLSAHPPSAGHHNVHDCTRHVYVCC